MKITFWFSLSCTLLFMNLMTPAVYAKPESFVKEYTYEAGESDSKLICRTIALEQVKRLLLEELGTYLISNTEVLNSQLTKDQIITYTSGVVMTVIIDEKWDGQKYALKAKITADPEDVAKAINLLRTDHERTEEIQELQAQSKAALQEIYALKKELAKTKRNKNKQAQYLKSVNTLLSKGLMEKGIDLKKRKKYRESIKVFSDVLKYNPKYSRALYLRGWAYYELKEYGKAANDYDLAINISPTNLYPYYGKGWIAVDQKRYDEALELFEKTISSDPKFAPGYNGRGYCYLKNGAMEKAKTDFDKAIELDPAFGAVYVNRGFYYFKSGDYKNALIDYTKGIETDPLRGKWYFGRGQVHSKMNNLNKANEDYKVASDLGFAPAKKKLLKHK